MPAEVAAKSPQLPPTPSSPAPNSPPTSPASQHIRLTSHAGGQGAIPIHWAAATATERGPVVGTTTNRSRRKHRVSPLRLARVHVGDVDLDERYGHACKRVANGEA